MMIMLADYFMGRDVDPRYAAELSNEIRTNATETVRRANVLLSRYYAAQPDAERARVTSGWRPKAVNASISNAAPRSRHMTGQAIDLSDPEGDLDAWCMDNLDILAGCGLWLESPASTKGWCHVQTVPPRSGSRVFFP